MASYDDYERSQDLATIRTNSVIDMLYEKYLKLYETLPDHMWGALCRAVSDVVYGVLMADYIGHWQNVALRACNKTLYAWLKLFVTPQTVEVDGVKVRLETTCPTHQMLVEAKAVIRSLEPKMAEYAAADEEKRRKEAEEAEKHQQKMANPFQKEIRPHIWLLNRHAGAVVLGATETPSELSIPVTNLLELLEGLSRGYPQVGIDDNGFFTFTFVDKLSQHREHHALTTSTVFSSVTDDHRVVYTDLHEWLRQNRDKHVEMRFIAQGVKSIDNFHPLVWFYLGHREESDLRFGETMTVWVDNDYDVRYENHVSLAKSDRATKFDLSIKKGTFKLKLI
jgi:hypothetical protein